MPLYTFRRPPDPPHRQQIAPLAGPSGTQVDTAYTVGGIIPTTLTAATYTLGGEVRAPVTTAYTLGGEVQAPVTIEYNVGGAVLKTIVVQYTLGALLAIVPVTTYTLGGAVQGAATTAYTVGGVVGAVVVRPFYPLLPGPYEGATTDFWLCDAFGKVLAVIGPDTYLEAEYSHAVNTVTPLTLLLPPDFNYDLIHDDGWVLPMRRVGRSPASLDGERPFFVNGRGKRINAQGGKMIEVHAESALTIANRRIVAYSSEGTYGHKVGPIDQYLSQVMTDNFGTTALDVTRNASAYLDVMAYTLNTWVPYYTPPTVDLQISRARVLDALQQGVQAAAAPDGFEVFFDIVLNSWGNKKLQFRWYFGQRGKDRTRGKPGAVMLSIENGTLSNVTMFEDFKDEFNFVYVRGKGEGDQVLTTSLQDANLIGKGPFARREGMYTSNQTTTPTALVSEGQSALRQGRPRQTLTADIPSTADYGRLWRFGDKMNTSFDGTIFTVQAQGVNIHISDGEETVQANLRAEVAI